MPTKSLLVQTSRRVRRVLLPLALQSLLWIALTGAFAALLMLAGSQSWANALRFSAVNWMPWLVLAPLVFWFSSRFPVERPRLWRHVPAHIVACAACTALTLWVATAYTFPPRPSGSRSEERERAAAREVPPPPREGEDSAAPTPRRNTVAGKDESHHVGGFSRSERAERFGREGREPFGRRGAFWWPFVGTTLLRANFGAAVYLIVAIAAHAAGFYRRAQKREREALALAAGLNRAKLDALRLQLQPHFLFNTLNAISTLVHRDATAADELIGDLSELLRLSLLTADHEVPLSRELELLDCYLAIEQTRLADRLRIVREIDPTVTDALVPTFLLQPLVENAIRHGIEPRLAPGTVTIRARRDGERLQLSVIDDGVGLAASGQPTARRGIGISNTEARLRALHGSAAQLSFVTPPTGGADVGISLPFSTTPRADASPAPA